VSKTWIVINYVAQYKLPEDERWTDWSYGDQGDEEAARQVLSELVASRRRRGGRLVYQVVKRTAVITDEVILEEPEKPEEP
jgi:hypothetical protein